MFGPDDEAKYEQALQGELGNCWLVVAAASIAEDPDRIHDIVEIDVKNSVGIYATSMYLLGMPITVIVDDYLPIEPMDNSQTRYAQVPEDGALWGPILEKTFAKYLGNYEAIDAGVASHGIEALLGSPYNNWTHAELLDEGRTEELWDAMVAADNSNKMISCGSYTGTGSD